MRLIQQCLKGMWRAIDVLIFAAMMLMIALVFTNAVLRYGFHSGVLASAEISRFLFVWIILLGATICLRDRRHLSLGMIEHMLPESVRLWQQRFVYGVIALSCGMLALGSYRQTIANWPNISPLSGIPVGVLYLAGFIAGAMMTVIAVYHIVFPPQKENDEAESDQ